MQEYSQRNERAPSLKDLLSTTKSSTSNKTNYSRKGAKPSKKQIYFSWYHHDAKKGNIYTSKRAVRWWSNSAASRPTLSVSGNVSTNC